MKRQDLMLEEQFVLRVPSELVDRVRDAVHGRSGEKLSVEFFGIVMLIKIELLSISR